MSIFHLEDLPLNDFIKAVQNIGNMHASEKLDGGNCWLGLDNEGKLFTSREGKSKRAGRFYSEERYPAFAAYNGFRSAHAALEAKFEDIKRIMQPNQMVECEVLYGRQPNAVTYGANNKSYIAFLRGVNGTPDVVADQLSTALGGTSVKVNVNIISTTNGEDLRSDVQEITYQFTGAQRIDPSKLKDVNLTKHVDALIAYLQKPSEIGELTNGDLLTTNLGSINVDERPDAKLAKSAIVAKIMADFKLPIKRELLDNYVLKIKPALSASDLTSDEDLGVEGIVLRDPTTGNLIKLVDKDAFTTINAFNHAIRNQISNVTKTLDPNAPLEARGGITGNMKTKIADLLGNVELARGSTAKRALAKVKDTTPIGTIKAFASNLNIPDFLGMKRKLLAIVQQAAVDMRAMLQDFTANKDNFQLKLKNGRVIGISPEINMRTLLVFAESRRNLLELFYKLKKTQTTTQVIAILYGGLAKQVHETEDLIPNLGVTESIITEKKYDTDKARYSGKDAYTIVNIYFATVFMAVILYKAQDARGIRMLKDRTHYKLASWDVQMSPLNFWGYPIWKASSPPVKKLIGPKAAGMIFKIARRAAPSWSRYLHMDLSFGKDVPIDWVDHFKTLHTLQQFDGMNTDRINILMKGVFLYDTATHDQRVKTITKLFYFVNQFIPTSPLFIRIKAIQDELLLNANGENDQMVQEMKLLTVINALAEDENPNTAAETSSQVTIATRAADANPSKDGGNKMQMRKRNIEKRKRNPKIKKAKFLKPANSLV